MLPGSCPEAPGEVQEAPKIGPGASKMRPQTSQNWFPRGPRTKKTKPQKTLKNQWFFIVFEGSAKHEKHHKSNQKWYRNKCQKRYILSKNEPLGSSWAGPGSFWQLLASFWELLGASGRLWELPGSFLGASEQLLSSFWAASGSFWEHQIDPK